MRAGFERPSDAWLRDHGFLSFQKLQELPEGVRARVICQPTENLTPVAAHPLGNLFTGILADTTPSSASSYAQSWQEVGEFDSGTVGSTAATADLGKLLLNLGGASKMLNPFSFYFSLDKKIISVSYYLISVAPPKC